MSHVTAVLLFFKQPFHKYMCISVCAMCRCFCNTALSIELRQSSCFADTLRLGGPCKKKIGFATRPQKPRSLQTPHSLPLPVTLHLSCCEAQFCNTSLKLKTYQRHHDSVLQHEARLCNTSLKLKAHFGFATLHTCSSALAEGHFSFATVISTCIEHSLYPMSPCSS